MIQATILCDSIATTCGRRLTSFLLTYPRFIHSELMTHRMFSRNAASSRAIPFARMAETVMTNPAMPVKWGAAQPGMQSGAEVADKDQAVMLWLSAMEEAHHHAQQLDKLGIHKSISNRLLEPFAHMTTIVTATDWDNFYSLRAHPDAQPEFQELAYLMLDVYLASTPVWVVEEDWHLPFISLEERRTYATAVLRQASVARCARVSYANFKETTIEEDQNLCERLRTSGHWSPFEHVATPAPAHIVSGNFKGWRQWRKFFAEENRSHEDLYAILEKRNK